MTTIIEDLKFNIKHAKSAIECKREEIRKLELDINYYQGEHDALNSLLSEIEQKKVTT